MLGISTRDSSRSYRRALCSMAAIAAFAAGCTSGSGAPRLPASAPLPEATVGAPQSYVAPAADIDLVVLTESGRPVLDAWATTDGETIPPSGGVLRLNLDQPTLVVVQADNRLPEPIVLTPEMAPEVEIRMLDRVGPGGEARVVLHFGGDFMMGRRYQEASLDERARVSTDDGGASARAVVAAVAPLFASADLSSVNFESVIGELPIEAAYPAKRFLLQTPPVAVAALEELGVDVVTLGNNHVNDWQEVGLETTLAALAEAGVAAPGAGSDDATARRPALLDAAGTTVGILSYTTVTGDFVNDSLPDAGDPIPANLAATEVWQYETRPFRFVAGNHEQPIPAGDYRPGDAWRRFISLEGDLTAEAVADLWTALTAPDAFPELQDWVARRGHGGAARFRSSAVAEDVAALRTDGADLVVVQIHGGYQFAEVASEYFAEAARTAVDAGADLVVGHHPHVLQGFEWYGDTLIAHSLGNFAFDQDFLATFPSVVLRTVFEGDRLLQAKLYPVVLNGYRPTPASGDGARRILRTVAERSLGEAVSIRLPNDSIGAVASSPGPGVEPARLEIAAGAATIVRGGPAAAPAPSPSPGETVWITGDDLVTVPADPAVLIGRDLFGWGTFEDVEADGTVTYGAQWRLPHDGPVTIRTVADAPSGIAYLELDARASVASGVVVRPVARITPSLHRTYDGDGTPLDDAADFSVEAAVRVEGGGTPFVRLDGYRFIDTIPTEDPESTLLVRLELPLDVPADGTWHAVRADLPADALDTAGGAVNAVMLYVGVSAPISDRTVAGFDDVAFVEWRPASSYPPDAALAADAVRSATLD